MMSDWLQKSNVVLKGVPGVLAAHASTIRILHTLKPVGVAMAGANEFDPYKD
jgi:tRNA-splicing ligase RtcB